MDIWKLLSKNATGYDLDINGGPKKYCIRIIGETSWIILISVLPMYPALLISENIINNLNDDVTLLETALFFTLFGLGVTLGYCIMSRLSRYYWFLKSRNEKNMRDYDPL